MAESGLLKAGRILVLVGAIVSAVTAAVLVVVGVVIAALLHGQDARVIGMLYPALGLVLAMGATFGFLAHGRVKRGEVHGAWVFGLTAALLPPVQGVALIGAILIYASPEHEEWKAGHA